MSAIDPDPGVGIVVAMAAEERHFLAVADEVESLANPVFRTHLLRIGETSCVVIRSGIGMVHAAAATEALILEHRPTMVLNFGCAGAHNRDLYPGDVIVGDRCVYHTAGQILPNGTERYAGFIREEGSSQSLGGESDEVSCDPQLIERAVSAAKRDGIAPWPGSSRKPAVRVGAVASADLWTQATERLDMIHQRHQTWCEDMEAAAIGRIAALHGLPFLSVKDISNNEYHRSSDISEFTDFPVAEVGKRSAAIIASVVRDLGSRDCVTC